VNPLTHLLASWIIAAKTTDNLRDRRLVTLAGVAPDLDGLGIFADYAHGAYITGKFYYYPQYHHMLAHGLPAAIICSTIMAVLARRHWRVFWLSFLTFHLHLLCDLVGSRGPDKNDLWPIYYFAPWRMHPTWVWRHQWPLNGWQNWLITMVLFSWALWLAVKIGDSFVGVINRRFDRIFVSVLQKWHGQLWPRTASGS
jgi:inner membrane protein